MPLGAASALSNTNRDGTIVTERDLLRRVLANKVNIETSNLSSVMTSNVMLAKPTDAVVDWLRIMSNERFRHLPVVDIDGRLITVMSQGDFVSYTWPDLINYFGAKASETVRGPSSPLIVMVAGIMLYSIIMVVVMKYI